MLEQVGVVSISDLAREFGTSPITVRRDLLALERDGYLVRTHGGATAGAARPIYEPSPYVKRETEHGSGKKAITSKAATYVRDGDTLIINAGTTMHALAAQLRNARDLQVVTNGLTVATELAASHDAQVFMLGGSIDFKKMGTVGPRAEEAMRDVHVEKAFLGITGISIEHGLFMHSAAEAQINRLFVAAAREITVVVDSSKFDVPCLFRVASLQEIDRIITDDGIRPEIKAVLERLDLELIIVAT